MSRLKPYEPIGTLKPVADDLWIVDGPVIEMGYLAGSTLPFTTRMTIIRLPDGGLWVHSPTPTTPGLRAEIDALGKVRHIVAPNRLHYWWVGDWRETYPQARTYAAPNVRENARKHGRFFEYDTELEEEAAPAWAGAIDQILVPGGFLTEVDFFHRRSRTLILTDLIENFEPQRIRSAILRFLVRLSGAAAPDGSMPIDLRLTFLLHRKQVRAAMKKMLGWEPERVILAHGAWYDSDARARLRHAFRWAL